MVMKNLLENQENKKTKNYLNLKKHLSPILKRGNLPKNNVIKRFNFLNSDTKIAFNYLQLAFTKALIL